MSFVLLECRGQARASLASGSLAQRGSPRLSTRCGLAWWVQAVQVVQVVQVVVLGVVGPPSDRLWGVSVSPSAPHMCKLQCSAPKLLAGSLLGGLVAWCRWSRPTNSRLLGCSQCSSGVCQLAGPIPPRGSLSTTNPTARIMSQTAAPLRGRASGEMEERLFPPATLDLWD